MRWYLAMELVSTLVNDDEFISTYKDKSFLVCNDILGCAQGRLIEDIILKDTKNALQSIRFSVFRYRFNNFKYNNKEWRGEYDMVIHDRQEAKVYLFEIKRAFYPNPSHIKNLKSKARDEIIENHLGTKIAGKYVLYSGPENRNEKIPYLNSADFLKAKHLKDFLQTELHVDIKESQDYDYNPGQNLS